DEIVERLAAFLRILVVLEVPRLAGNRPDKFDFDTLIRLDVERARIFVCQLRLHQIRVPETPRTIWAAVVDLAVVWITGLVAAKPHANIAVVGTKAGVRFESPLEQELVPNVAAAEDREGLGESGCPVRSGGTVGAKSVLHV